MSSGLEASGCTVAAVALEAAEDLTHLVRASGAEAVVCALDDPSPGALESLHVLHRAEPRPVVNAQRLQPPANMAAAETGS